MRGLDEIKNHNEEPHRDHRESLAFGNDRFTGAPDFDHRKLDDAGARRLLGALFADEGDSILDDDRTTPADFEKFVSHGIDNHDRIRRGGPRMTTADAIGTLALLAALDDIARGPRRPRTLADRPRQHADARAASSPKAYDHQETIAAALGIDAPPFLKFWAKLNDERNSNGLPDALYGEAKRFFEGGETPLGAMTFVGKPWDGIRSVPSTPVDHLGGHRPLYHGEYRTVTEDGVVWHKVLNKHDQPIAYALPEAALVAAKEKRDCTVPKAQR